jgi:chromosomal replication initiator protein
MPYFKNINTKPNQLYNFDTYFNDQEEINNLKYKLQSNTLSSLVISSNSGRGVTHLLNAISNSLLDQNKHILYISAQWLLHVTKTLKTEEKKNDFIKKLKTYDVLAIDNIQFLYRKAKNQSAFIQKIIECFTSSHKLVLLGCSDASKDITRSKKIFKHLSPERIELRQLSSLDVFKVLKQLCSAEDNIPDNLIYAISGYNGSIQQHINCLISIRFNMKSVGVNPERLSLEEFNSLFDLKKYFPKQQFRKCFAQAQLRFTRSIELKTGNSILKS